MDYELRRKLLDRASRAKAKANAAERPNQDAQIDRPGRVEGFPQEASEQVPGSTGKG